MFGKSMVRGGLSLKWKGAEGGGDLDGRKRCDLERPCMNIVDVLVWGGGSFKTRRVRGEARAAAWAKRDV